MQLDQLLSKSEFPSALVGSLAGSVRAHLCDEREGWNEPVLRLSDAKVVEWLRKKVARMTEQFKQIKALKHLYSDAERAGTAITTPAPVAAAAATAAETETKEEEKKDDSASAPTDGTAAAAVDSSSSSSSAAAASSSSTATAAAAAAATPTVVVPSASLKQSLSLLSEYLPAHFFVLLLASYGLGLDDVAEKKRAPPKSWEAASGAAKISGDIDTSRPAGLPPNTADAKVHRHRHTHTHTRAHTTHTVGDADADADATHPTRPGWRSISCSTALPRCSLMRSCSRLCASVVCVAVCSARPRSRSPPPPRSWRRQPKEPSRSLRSSPRSRPLQPRPHRRRHKEKQTPYSATNNELEALNNCIDIDRSRRKEEGGGRRKEGRRGEGGVWSWRFGVLSRIGWRLHSHRPLAPTPTTQCQGRRREGPARSKKSTNSCHSSRLPSALELSRTAFFQPVRKASCKDSTISARRHRIVELN